LKDETLGTVYDLTKETKVEEEDKILSRLLWYLNSGGRRKWIVKERPDKIHNLIPRPDFLCKEQKSGEEITIEITYASGIKEGKKFKTEEEKLFSIAFEASTIIREKLINPPTGMYVSKTTICRDPRDRSDVSNVVDTFIKEIGTGNLSTFDKVSEFPILLVFSSPNILRLWDPDPLNAPGLANYEVLEDEVRKDIREANKKLENCNEGILLIFMDLIDLEEHDILFSFADSRTNYDNVKRFYALSVLNSCLYRIW
jgi:hypothetical protein